MSRFGMYPPRLARQLERVSAMTEAEAYDEYWRLQARMEAMPQATYEGPEGDDLNTLQDECQRRVAELTGDPHWHEHGLQS